MVAAVVVIAVPAPGPVVAQWRSPTAFVALAPPVPVQVAAPPLMVSDQALFDLTVATTVAAASWKPLSKSACTGAAMFVLESLIDRRRIVGTVTMALVLSEPGFAVVLAAWAWAVLATRAKAAARVMTFFI